MLGKKQEALETLRRALDAGYANVDWPRQDPDLEILYDDPEFLKLFAAKK